MIGSEGPSFSLFHRSLSLSLSLSFSLSSFLSIVLNFVAFPVRNSIQFSLLRSPTITDLFIALIPSLVNLLTLSFKSSLFVCKDLSSFSLFWFLLSFVNDRFRLHTGSLGTTFRRHFSSSALLYCFSVRFPFHRHSFLSSSTSFLVFEQTRLSLYPNQPTNQYFNLANLLNILQPSLQNQN